MLPAVLVAVRIPRLLVPPKDADVSHDEHVVVRLVGGGLKTFAASKNRLFRGHGIGVVALWSAVPTAVVCPCAPSGLALLAYGSIV